MPLDISNFKNILSQKVCIVYRNGEGVDRDIQKAIILYEKSAMLRNQNAMRELVKIYKDLDMKEREEHWAKRLESFSR